MLRSSYSHRSVLADAVGTGHTVFLWSVNVCSAVAAVSRFGQPGPAGDRTQSLAIPRSRSDPRPFGPSPVLSAGVAAILRAGWILASRCLDLAHMRKSPVLVSGGVLNGRRWRQLPDVSHGGGNHVRVRDARVFGPQGGQWLARTLQMVAAGIKRGMLSSSMVCVARVWTSMCVCCGTASSHARKGVHQDPFPSVGA